MNEFVKPKIAVLLAAYNGGEWIKDQLYSILDQDEVAVTIHISIDPSIDDSETSCKLLAGQYKNITVLPNIGKFGSAGKNFFRLIKDVDLTGFDYVAFADQDDIWEADKLIRHIRLARQYGADGVSSNVTAFWPDGSEKLIDKAQPQNTLDYLFESAGPGCTFLMTPWLVNKVREQLLDKNSQAKKVVLHDWLTYAICRAHGGKWLIDPEPSLYYRQHSNNVVGANVGFKPKWVRLQKLRQGWYRREVIKIAQVCNSIAPDDETNRLLVLLQTKNLISQLKLLAYVSKARRSLVDRCLMAASIVVGLF
jgi:rhamnosyltransferase